MYIPPRPKVEDDPNFPLRLGVVIVIAFFAMDWMQPVFLALIATLSMTLASGMRKATNPGRVIGAPVAMALLTLFVWAGSSSNPKAMTLARIPWCSGGVLVASY